MKYLELLLKNHGFTEVFIGIWQNTAYETLFDLNSGGMEIYVSEERAVYLPEDSRATQFIKTATEYLNVKYRSDMPF
tara:strand:- start:311 stop:541 length:231 start_codon:yes stop_codon:yes gene_type:complete